MGAVAVASEDEQVGAVGGGHDFALGTAGAFAAGARAPKPCRRVCQELFGGGGSQVFHRCTGVAFGACAAEKSSVGAMGCAGGLGTGDMQQHDLRALGCPGAGGVHASFLRLGVCGG